MIDCEIENFVYNEIKKYSYFIEKYSREFDIDPKIIISLIYVERIQYKLDSLRNFAKSIKDSVEDLAKIFYKNDDVKEFFDSSKGFSHIKFGTARYLVRKYRDKGTLTDLELGTYPENIDIAIKFSCAIIREHILMWQEKVQDIKNRVDILATLYNISDFENKIPHNSPKSGGSVLPVIVDGAYIKNMCFGDRVKKVYESKNISLL